MYTIDADLRAQLIAGATATKAAKAESRAAAKALSPIREKLSRNKEILNRALKLRARWRTWMNWTDAECESTHGQEWRDLQAKIARIDSEITTAQITLLLHTQGAK